MIDGSSSDRPKIRIVLPPIEAPEEPPDLICVICEKLRDGWQFRHEEALSPICIHCRVSSMKTIEAFGYGLDWQHVNRAQSVLKALENLANAR